MLSFFLAQMEADASQVSRRTFAPPHRPFTPRALLRMTSDQRPQLLEVRLWWTAVLVKLKWKRGKVIWAGSNESSFKCIFFLFERRRNKPINVMTPLLFLGIRHYFKLTSREGLTPVSSNHVTVIKVKHSTSELPGLVSVQSFLLWYKLKSCWKCWDVDTLRLGWFLALNETSHSNKKNKTCFIRLNISEIQKPKWIFFILFFYLCDVGESNDVGYDAHDSDEYLPALSEDVREFIHQRGDETFNSAELETAQSENFKISSEDEHLWCCKCVFLSSGLPGCQSPTSAAWRRREWPKGGKWAAGSLPQGRPKMQDQVLMETIIW